MCFFVACTPAILDPLTVLSLGRRHKMHAETASLCIRPLLVRALYLSVTEWLLLVRPRQQQHLKFLLWGRTNRVTGLC